MDKELYSYDIETSLFLEFLLGGEVKTEQFGSEKKELVF